MKRNNQRSLRLTAYRETGERKQTIYPFILSALVMTGIPLAVMPAFECIQASPLVFAALGAVLSVPMVMLFQSRFRDNALIATVIMSVLFAAVFFGKVRSGSLMLVNDFLKFLTTKTGHIYLAFETGPASDVYWILAVVLFLLCAFTVKASLTASPSFILLPLAAVAAGTAGGLFRVNAGTVVLFTALVLLALRRVHLKTDPSCPEKSVWAHIIISVLCAAMVLSGFMLPDIKSGEMISSVKRAYHEFVYDEETNSMPEGDLSDLPAWDASTAPALAVTAEEYSKLYLRGFTGEVYTGTSWEALSPEELAEYDSTFYWLHDDGFYGQSIIANAVEASGGEEPAGLILENLGACRKYAFMPYSVSAGSLMDPSLIGDAYAEGRAYERMEYYPGSIPEWYALQHYISATQTSEETAGYLSDEQQYRDFVYEKYLQITPAAVATLKKYLDTDENARTFSDIRRIILDVLSEKVSYDEGAVILNGKTDFLTCLMEQENRGYSVAYATAAALMLRYYGVPSRYVEGYFMSTEEAEALEGGERFVLDEHHAHAWAEYYLDGIGWIPFEATPGYIDENEYELSETGGDGNISYLHNELVYAPAIEPRPLEEDSGPRTSFRVPGPALALLLLLLAALLASFCALRRRRLRRTLEKIDSLDNRRCIAGLYGYAGMLLGKAGITDGTDEKAALLNREAMFSDHEMSDMQKEEMKAYVKGVIEKCRNNWNALSRFYYRFVNCLYL